FKILAFLLNQFGGKVPGSIPEIKNFAFTRFKAEYHLFSGCESSKCSHSLQFLKFSAEEFVVTWSSGITRCFGGPQAGKQYTPTTSPLRIKV
ncbi:hypothetical protein SOVF_016870 isoform B, partial [Spinacia oleracea]